MANAQLHNLLRHLRRLASERDAVALADAELLERFVTQRDDAAFELLVWRHGLMVLSVCRRILRHEQDAEDAFQATFLILARKASSIGKQQAVAGWIHKVAYRIALESKRRAAKMHADDGQAALRLVSSPPTEALVADLREVMDEEINRLPARYRVPVVLCYLEGKTYAEAARQMACPEGTVAIRLLRARQRLRVRLTRRGLTLSAGALVASLSAQSSAATLPAALVGATLRVATLIGSGQTAAAAGVSTGVIALSHGVLRTMFMTKLKIVAASILAGAIGTGTVFTSYRAFAVSPEDGSTEAKLLAPGVGMEQFDEDQLKKEIARLQHELKLANQQIAQLKAHSVEVPSPHDGIVLFIGTKIKDGEEVKPAERINVGVGAQGAKYRRFTEGEHVEKGQLLAKLDDRLHRADLNIKEAKVEVSEAEMLSARKTCEEARARYDTQKRLSNTQVGKVTAEEELRGARLLLEKNSYELFSKQKAVKVAKVEWERARMNLESCEIRSPVGGVVTVLYKHAGEAVKGLEPLFRVRLVKP